MISYMRFRGKFYLNACILALWFQAFPEVTQMHSPYKSFLLNDLIDKIPLIFKI
jgi:VanZ family protein